MNASHQIGRRKIAQPVRVGRWKVGRFLQRGDRLVGIRDRQVRDAEGSDILGTMRLVDASFDLRKRNADVGAAGVENRFSQSRGRLEWTVREASRDARLDGSIGTHGG